MTTGTVDFPQKRVEGESGMITCDAWGTIKALHRQGWSQQKIPRELDVDPKTVRRTLDQQTRFMMANYRIRMNEHAKNLL